MMKIANKKILPLFVFTILFLYSTNAHALVGAIVDLAMAAVEAVLEAMGLIGGSCPAPKEKATGECLFCPLFKILFNAGSVMAENSYTMFKDGLVDVLLVFLAVSLALIALKNLASFGSKDPSALINEFVKKAALVCVIAVILAQGYQHVLSLVITPIFETAIHFIDLSNDNAGLGACPGSVKAGIKGFTGNPTVGFSGSGGIPLAVGESIICAVEAMERKINMVFEYGDWAFCRGIKTDGLFIFKLVPNPIYIVDGILLYIGGLFLLVGYPWVVADAILQLGIAMALLPFGVCGFAFNGTKSYLAKLLSWILNSMFSLLFMGILITCVVGYIDEVLRQAIRSVGSDSLFVNAVNGLAFYGTNLLMIMFIMIVGWTYMPTVRDLAKNFAVGAGASASKTIETFARENAEKAGNYAQKKAEQATVAGIKAGAKGAQNLGRRAAMRGVDYFGHTNVFGSGYKVSNMKLFGKSYTVETAPDGKRTFRTYRTSLFSGRRIETISDGLSLIEMEYDGTRLVKSRVKFKYASMEKNLLDKNGNINRDAVKELMNSNVAKSHPEYAKLLMAEVAIKSLKAKGYDLGKNYNSRNIIFDPRDPNKISIVQQDFSGKKTTLSLEFDPKTGRAGVGQLVERKRSDGSIEKEYMFDNGMLKLQGRTVIDKHGSARSITEYSYSAMAQKGHDHYTDDDGAEANQVVAENGEIAKDLDPTRGGKKEMDLMLGIDNFLAQASDGCSQPVTRGDVITGLADARRRRSGKFYDTLFVS